MVRASWLRIAVPLTGVLLATSACGNSGGDADGFVFTPVPYTVIIGPTETEVPFSAERDDGLHYATNEVTVELQRDELAEFIRWAQSYGFRTSILIDSDRYSWVHVLVEVPWGAAPAAKEFIERHQDVDAVFLNHFGELQD